MEDKTKEKIDETAGAGTVDKLEGNTKEAAGRVKEAAGALSGDDKLRAEGMKEQTGGKAQHLLGEIKEGTEHLLDKAKDALHKHHE